MMIFKNAVMVLTIALCFTHQAKALLTPHQVNQLTRLNLKNLKSELREIVSQNHDSLGYDRARKTIFQKLDNDQGQVCCVYSNNKCLRVSKVPSHKIMNVEHTWPQSLGARGTAKSDLHHLFPTTSSINSTRSNFPFCKVNTAKWAGDGSKMGKDSSGVTCFEPPDHHKGDIARAMFYFSIRYNYRIDQSQEKVLKRWHQEDPVDSTELKRHKRILDFQHNTNVFIENPELVDEISDF